MSSLKHLALEVGFRAGVFEVARRAIRRHHAVILTFHRFSGNGKGHPRGLPIQRFAECMEYLARHYRVVSLRTLTRELSQGVVRPYTVAVTVDDGYDEVFTLAAPVLRKYRVPASVFVISEFVDGRVWPWTDRFAFVFERAPRDRLAFSHRGTSHVLEMQEEQDRRRAATRWVEYAKRLPTAERDELLEAVAEAARVEIPVTPPPEYRSLTWRELRALAAEGLVDIGSHTRTHPILSRVGPAELLAEIEGSRRRIEQMLGRPVRHFAYPNGGEADYTREAVELVARAGYRAAVTSLAGGNTPSTSPFELRRFAAGGDADSLAHFAQLVSGLEQVKLRVRAELGLDRMLPRIRAGRRPVPAGADE